MKKTILTLTIALFGYCAYAQSFFTTSSYANSPHGVGANSIFGWGENFDSSIDVRPNSHSTFGTMIINYHTGLTFSAHSYYGGIRFYNQGYPNPYDSSNGSIMVMSITNGNVGIGTTTPDAKLSVNGTIHTKEVKVDLTGWPDYVFKLDYKLPSLAELRTYIDKNQHLPDMPSEQEVAKNGINLGEMNKLLTKKVEELILYLLEKDKQVGQLQDEVKQLKAEQGDRIAALEAALSKLAANK